MTATETDIETTIFQVLNGTRKDVLGATEDEIRNNHRRLVRLIHPDMVPDELKDRANEAFLRLQKMLEEDTAPTKDIIFHAKNNSYRLGKLLLNNGVTNLYRAVTLNDDETPVVIRMPHIPKANQLVAAEAEALTKLNAIDPPGNVFFPTLVESFKSKDQNRVLRQCNVLSTLDGFYSLSQVIEAYPNGIHPRDTAWMIRRVFAAIRNADSIDLACGGLAPSNVWVHPEQHGIMLADWCFSVPRNGTMKAAPKDWFEPPEAKAKEHIDARTDIYSVGKLIGWLSKDQTPRPMRAFAAACTLPKPQNRPEDPQEILEDFGEMLYNLFGKPKFHNFTMPHPVA